MTFGDDAPLFWHKNKLVTFDQGTIPNEPLHEIYNAEIELLQTVDNTIDEINEAIRLSRFG